MSYNRQVDRITEADAMNDREPLEFPDRRETLPDAPDVPILQWANGRTSGCSEERGRYAPLVGWHIEAERDDGLDLILDEAGFQTVYIKHQRPGSVEIKRHWYLGEKIVVYPLTLGPTAETISGCLQHRDEMIDRGLGIAWPTGERSKFAVRVFLLIGTTPVLVQLAARSNMTDKLLAALRDHGRVVKAADALVDRTKHPKVVAYHEIGLPLVAGRQETFGKKESTDVIPFISVHPDGIDRDYIGSRWRPQAVHAAAVKAWPGIVDWAAGYGIEKEGWER